MLSVVMLSVVAPVYCAGITSKASTSSTLFLPNYLAIFSLR